MMVNPVSPVFESIKFGKSKKQPANVSDQEESNEYKTKTISVNTVLKSTVDRRL